MHTTLELRSELSDSNKKRILEILATLENIWNVSINSDLAQISLDYMTWADLKMVRRELEELGYHVSNDTHGFDTPEKPF